MYPNDQDKNSPNKPNKISQAPKNDRVAEKKQMFESLIQRDAPKPARTAGNANPGQPLKAQAPVSKPEPTDTQNPASPAKKESPYGYFKPIAQNAQSPVPSPRTGRGATQIDWSRLSGAYNVPTPVQLNPMKAEAVPNRVNNTSVAQNSARTADAEPKTEVQTEAERVAVETSKKNSPNSRVERKLDPNETIATGRFIVGGGKNWIQKDDDSHNLIHYHQDNLTESQKNLITASMEDQSKPSLVVSTQDKKLTITPRK